MKCIFLALIFLEMIIFVLCEALYKFDLTQYYQYLAIAF